MPSEYQPSQIIAALTDLATRRPEQAAYRSLADTDGCGGPVTYHRLADDVRKLAATLGTLVGPGNRVLLSMPPGLDYVRGFLACLAAKVIGVPLQPRAGVRSTAEDLAAHPVAVDCGATAALTADGVIAWDRPHPPGSEAAPDLAFLQYTSGSTGTPKGVMVSHANLAHNLATICGAMSIGPDDSVVTWLPPYHDMGLIGGMLIPLWAGIPVTLLTPQMFARRPLAWLQAISEHRATISGGPNFAFDMCVDRIAPEQHAGLDLSCWEIAFVGSEPVRPRTLRRFAEAFAGVGFSERAFYPCYGLAEGTLIVSGGRRGHGFATRRPDDAAESELVSCGRVLGNQSVRIVDPSGVPVPPGEPGEVLLRGPSVTRGYWRRPAQTQAGFDSDGWLSTGDLGAIVDGELYLSGRLKDMIVIRGRNVIPDDVEQAVQGIDRSFGAAAAFGVDTMDGERLVVLAEVTTWRATDDPEPVLSAVRAAVVHATGVQPHAVGLLRRGGLFRTTSGKVRRSACRAGYVGGGLRLLAEDRRADPPRDGTSLPPLLTRQALLGLAAADRVEALVTSLRAWVATAAGVPVNAVDPSAPPAAAGLDSLMLVALQGDVAARLGVRIPLSELSGAGSLLAAAAAIADAIDFTGQPGPAADEPVTPDGQLTPGQAATWYLEQRHPGTSMHVLTRAFRVEGPVVPARLNAALRLLAERHPALRASLRVRDGVPEAATGDPASVRLSVVEAGHWTGDEVTVFLRREALTPFDLATGPLLRATLLRRSDHSLLVFAVHHAAVDLWSASLLFAELDQAYRALTLDATPTLPSRAERGTGLTADRELASRRWWAATLTGDHPATSLPVDRARPQPVSLTTGLVTRHVADLAGKQLRDVAVQLAVSPFAVLLAGFKAVLVGYGNGDAVTVGTPAACRQDPRSRSVVGFLANPLPIRTTVAGDPTFAELAGQVHCTLMSALDHQDLPFASIVETVGASQQDGRNPLFDVMFVAHQPPSFALAGMAATALGVPGATLALGDLALRTVPVPPADSPVDLTVELAHSDEGTHFAVKYATGLFDAATAEAILDRYVATLRAALTDPMRPISTLTSDDRPAAGESGVEEIATLDVVSRLRRQAASTPDTIAIRQDGRALSYAGLLAASTRLAHLLRALGVGPEVCVGVAMPRTPDLVVALLAVWQAGGAYCPIDVSLPPTRLAAVVEDTEPGVIVTTRALADRLPTGLPLLVLDDPQVLQRLSEPPTAPITDVPHPEQLAHVLFTSGSTGRPKSVALPHRGVAALVAWTGRTYSRDELSAVLAGTALTFDLSVFELFGTLAAGGTVVLAEHTLDLPRILERDHITLLNTVPSVAAELLTHGLPDSVRTVNLAGEPLPAQLVGEFSRAGAERLLNLYGPSEDTTYSTFAEVWAGDDRLVTIGRPVSGSAVRVLTPRGADAEVGQPGELLLTGVKLARGYLRRPALTAERFVPDPGGSGRPGTRAYRTGDTVRRRHDGELIFLGRSDRQVKVRGVRIELDEVEAAIAAHPGVREVAVQVVDPGGTGACLVAYLVSDLPAAELRRHAATRLPSALVPGRYVSVDRMPRTTTGKLDRTALAAMPVPAPLPGSARAVTDTERAVARVWSEVLGIADPDPDADFFLDGGHSLLAMRLLAGIERRFGPRISLEQFFAHPTISGLAGHVTARPGRPGSEQLASPGGAADTGGTFPLSPTQERFWLIHSLDPDSAAYHVPAVLRLRGPLDVPRLERALRQVVDRHDALRTCFRVVAGEPRQSPSLPGGVRMPVTDVTGDDTEVQAICQAEAARPFDLGDGPPWRVRLLRVADDDHRLIFVAHHIMCDGWSLELLARDLGVAYSTGQVSGDARSFLDWASAERRRWESSGGSGLDWWRERLRDLPDLRLPTDRPRQVGAVRTGAVLRRTLPPATVRALDRLARQEVTTRFAAISAIVMASLGVQSGQDRFGVGIPVAARTGAATADLFGCVANTVVLRADLTGMPTFRELLRRNRTEVRDALAHQDTPFAWVVRDVAAGRTLESTPLFQVAIGDQPSGLSVAMDAVETEVTPLDSGTVKFELTVLIDHGPGDQVTVGFEYDTTLFDRSTIGGLADRFIRLAEAAGSAPDVAIGTVELTDPTQRELLAEWGEGGAVADLGVRWLHDVVLAQADRTPDRVAVVAGDGSLTYAALAARTRRLAAGLRQRGIGTEDRVAICHERNSQLPVAVLGVLAAGAAYLPLRLTDPAERRAEMLADAGVRLVLCDEETASWLDTWDVPVATVDEVAGRHRWRDPDPPAKESAASLIDDRQLAYVLYTSGSTGKPKGVAVTHRGALARIAWARHAFDEAELSGVLVGTSLGFDLSLFEFFAPWSAGGTAVLAETVLDLPTLRDRDRVTLVTAVPSGMSTLLDLGGWPESVTTIGLGGEALTVPLARRVRSAGARRLVNLYGTTEDSFCSTWTELPEQIDTVTVGRPLPGSQIRVVNPRLTSVPPGVPGDIVSAGVGVARGYLGRPGLTASAFLPDPAGPPGSRLYLTGDRGRWTARGLEVAGRLDNQVKVRGHRIELGEVEAAIVALPGVAEVAVVASGDPGAVRLTAYLRPEPDTAAMDGSDLRAALRRRLPDYMVPSRFVVVDMMPRTGSGKLDRAELARCHGNPSAEVGQDTEPPRTAVEHELAGCWQELLGVPKVSRQDRFFDLGGDSLLAARMTTRINDRYGITLPIRLVFEDDRLSWLAEQVERAGAAAGSAAQD